MKSAGVRDLKTHLSGYLRDIAGGEVVLVTDRGRVVAELRPPGSSTRELSATELRYQRLVERGLLRPASTSKGMDWSALPRVRLRSGTAGDLLDAGREE